MMSRFDDLMIAIGTSVVLGMLVKVTVTTALALALVRLARHGRASVRHLLLLGAFIVLLALPAVTMLVPATTIAVPVSPAVIVTADPLRADSVAPAETIAVADRGLPTQPTSSVWTMPSATSLLVALWGLGAVLCLVPVLVGLIEVRSLRRAGLPWLAGRALLASIAPATSRERVDIVLHEGVPGPMTCGAVHHTIILPRDAEAWPPDDLHRALVHELEHVRRRDWISQCVARAVCAVYWFHPLVWMAWRRFTLEAERACDDAVLRHADATQYADQLVALARRLSVAGKAPVLAMANRRDLATRVTAVLDDRQSRGDAGWIAAALATLAGVLIVLVLGPVRMIAGPASDRLQADSRPRFDVVSLRPCAPSAPGPGRGGSAGTASPGRLRIDCQSLFSLIHTAYQVYADGRVNPPPTYPTLEPDISSPKAPDWMRTVRFTIEATAETASPTAAVMQGPMLQTLLEDRFKLKMHRETREVASYDLVVAKGGPKLKPLEPGTCVPYDWSVSPQPPLEAGQRRCENVSARDASGTAFVENAEAMTLDEVAAMVGGGLDRAPVVNKTGLTGFFSFRLVYTDHDAFLAALKDQLGLELRPARAKRDFLVIDHVEQPAADGAVPQQASPSPRFEAVSIRPCVDNTPPPGANGGARSGQGGFPTISPGRFTIDCGTVERLISNAYVLNGERLTNNDARIGDVSWWKGGPEWIRYDKFTIEASAPGVTDRAILLGPMLRTLLEERFKLKLHRETQDATMYALTIAKEGLKIQPMPPGGCVEDRDQVFDAASARANAAAVNAGTAKPNCGGMTMMGSAGHSRWTIGGTTLPNFAHTLSISMDHYVVDRTGYDADTRFNIHLEFAPDEHVPGADKRNPRTEFAPADAPTIFAALEQQLGLKLEATKGPQAVLVIDHIERPTPDGFWVTPMRARGAGR